MSAFLAAVTVFFISMQTVIGPTPPGTGVMKPAFSFTPAPRHTIHTVTIHPHSYLSILRPVCVLSGITGPGSVMYVSVVYCYKYWQTIGMFQLVLVTVNTWLTRSPQIHCPIQRYFVIAVQYLHNPLLMEKKRQRQH